VKSPVIDYYGGFHNKERANEMDKAENEFKDLLQFIYVIGQESESIQTNDFIKVIESKLLSLLSVKN
jgi:hypothetical protein